MDVATRLDLRLVIILPPLVSLLVQISPLSLFIKTSSLYLMLLWVYFQDFLYLVGFAVFIYILTFFEEELEIKLAVRLNFLLVASSLFWTIETLVVR